VTSRSTVVGRTGGQCSFYDPWFLRK
jgi:hypothetical protein